MWCNTVPRAGYEDHFLNTLGDFFYKPSCHQLRLTTCNPDKNPNRKLCKWAPINNGTNSTITNETRTAMVTPPSRQQVAVAMLMLTLYVPLIYHVLLGNLLDFLNEHEMLEKYRTLKNTIEYYYVSYCDIHTCIRFSLQYVV